MALIDKPAMSEKLMEYIRKIEVCGHQQVIRGFQLNYSNKCNFHCAHCFTNAPDRSDVTEALTIRDVESLADQADALGAWEIDIQGGEPLMLPQLGEIARAIKPERFYLYITTNGWFLDLNKARELKEWGVDKVSVSIDHTEAEKHDSFRGKKGAMARALRALAHVKHLGMTANINITVGHYNAQSQELVDMLTFAQKHGYLVNFNMATPTGAWKGKLDVMATPEDTRHLQELRKRFRNVTRDLWAFFDKSHTKVSGCPAVNIFYINPKGDVLPCPYIQTKLGNIRTEPLRQILERAWKVRYFREYSEKCLAGEDREFAARFLNRDMSVMAPVPLDELFSASDR